MLAVSLIAVSAVVGGAMPWRRRIVRWLYGLVEWEGDGRRLTVGSPTALALLMSGGIGIYALALWGGLTTSPLLGGGGMVDAVPAAVTDSVFAPELLVDQALPDTTAYKALRVDTLPVRSRYEDIVSENMVTKITDNARSWPDSSDYGWTLAYGAGARMVSYPWCADTGLAPPCEANDTAFYSIIAMSGSSDGCWIIDYARGGTVRDTTVISSPSLCDQRISWSANPETPQRLYIQVSSLGVDSVLSRKYTPLNALPSTEADNSYFPLPLDCGLGGWFQTPPGDSIFGCTLEGGANPDTSRIVFRNDTTNIQQINTNDDDLQIEYSGLFASMPGLEDSVRVWDLVNNTVAYAKATAAVYDSWAGSHAAPMFARVGGVDINTGVGRVGFVNVELATGTYRVSVVDHSGYCADGHTGGGWIQTDFPEDSQFYFHHWNRYTQGNPACDGISGNVMVNIDSIAFPTPKLMVHNYNDQPNTRCVGDDRDYWTCGYAQQSPDGKILVFASDMWNTDGNADWTDLFVVDLPLKPE